MSSQRTSNQNPSLNEPTSDYYLKLDDYGLPSIPSDQILIAEQNTTLTLELNNGIPISHHISLISNIETPFPFGLIDSLLKTQTISRTSLQPYTYLPYEKTTSILFEISLKRPGPNQFLFIYQKPDNTKEYLTKPFYIIVQPILNISNKTIPIHSINMQTVLSKNIGTLSDIKEYFKEAHRLKYNMIHFTPIQKLGESNSLYCLENNNELNECFFDKGEEHKNKKMEQTIQYARDHYHIGSIVDIVLNHCASNSKWISEHPECAYNLINTPWLNCAYELDTVINTFSNKFANMETKLEFQPFITNDDELQQVMTCLCEEIEKAKLYEYFYIDIENVYMHIENAFLAFKLTLANENDNIEKHNKAKEMCTEYERTLSTLNSMRKYIIDNCIAKIGEERNGAIVNVDKIIAMLINMQPLSEEISDNQFLEVAHDFIKSINASLKETYTNCINEAINNIRNSIAYEFIHMKNKVTISKPLVNKYFVTVIPSDKSRIFACNGWIMESEDPNEPTPNFTKKGTYYYFKRKVNAWSDCIKLNYGTSIDDCSKYLLEHMTKYITDMATIFDGFRLDNAHSTPIYIAEYLMSHARTIKNNLLVIAELFTTKENEINFVNRIGINLMIRELIWCDSINGLAGQIHRFGGGMNAMLGKIEPEIYSYRKESSFEVSISKMKHLLPQLPPSILFDQTHDNETLLQKYNNLALTLTNLSCNSFVATAIGSTRGYEQCFPIQPSVVNEDRLYEFDKKFIEDVDKEVEEVKNVNVEFEYTDEVAMRISIAFDSHGWKPDVEMVKTMVDDKSIFKAKVTLANNARHVYKFVIDGSNWKCDESKPMLTDNKGNVNNYMDIGTVKTDEDYKKMEEQYEHITTYETEPKEVEETTTTEKETPIKKTALPLTEYKHFERKDLKYLRRLLNTIRNDLSTFNTSIYIKTEQDYLSIYRSSTFDTEYIRSKHNYDGYAMICRTGHSLTSSTLPTSFELPGVYTEFVCACSLTHNTDKDEDINAFKSNPTLKGTKCVAMYTSDEKYFKSISQMKIVNNRTVITLDETIRPNTVIIVKFKVARIARKSIIEIENEIADIYKMRKAFADQLSMCDINLILFKCDKEELDNSEGKRSTYGLKDWGNFVYAGISHMHKVLNEVKLTQNNHPLLDNIREGDWLLYYIISRYEKEPNLVYLYEQLLKIYRMYNDLYVHFKPVYATKIIDLIYNIATTKIILRTKSSLVNYSPFMLKLITAIYQFTGYVESSRFKHNISSEYNKLSISAGLPHFSNEYMRCWGRDTFIALRGLMLLPGYYNEAREIIINYASTMRHGLIPNLLDGGTNPRYNARDATWFFMNAIVDYVNLSGDEEIFKQKVNMIFLSDNIDEHLMRNSRNVSIVMPLEEIMHQILYAHVRGISFREWRAGRQIDEQMSDEGFNVNVYFNSKNGFIYGGNSYNCGTWMDKMGSSEFAGNKGIPATPRNGADIEIIALLYNTLSFLNEQYKKGNYSYSNIELDSNETLSYEKWADLIKNNFENEFYIPNKQTYRDFIYYTNDPVEKKKYLHYEEQIRPNMFIAMSAAPSLFNKEHVCKCIKIAEEYLYVPECVGIRTLDNRDKDYHGDYNVDDNGSGYHTAHGFNYHNGPEWVFPFGYYLNTKVLFNEMSVKEEIVRDVCERMLPCMKYIEKDVWSGLPELTNKNGAFCSGSCCTQAWSIGTVLEAVEKLSKLK